MPSPSSAWMRRTASGPARPCCSRPAAAVSSPMAWRSAAHHAQVFGQRGVADLGLDGAEALRDGAPGALHAQFDAVQAVAVVGRYRPASAAQQFDQRQAARHGQRVPGRPCRGRGAGHAPRGRCGRQNHHRASIGVVAVGDDPGHGRLGESQVEQASHRLGGKSPALEQRRHGVADLDRAILGRWPKEANRRHQGSGGFPSPPAAERTKPASRPRRGLRRLCRGRIRSPRGRIPPAANPPESSPPAGIRGAPGRPARPITGQGWRRSSATAGSDVSFPCILIRRQALQPQASPEVG